MPCLTCLIRYNLVAHFPVILHASQTAIAKEPGNGSVIQVHLCQIHTITVAVHVTLEPEYPTFVIPQILIMEYVLNSTFGVGGLSRSLVSATGKCFVVISSVFNQVR